MLTLAVLARRPALDNVSVPPLSSTLVAAAVPVSVALPVTVRLGPPRLASTTAPVFRVVLALAVRVPLPPSVPARFRVAMVSLPPRLSVAPLSTVTLPPLGSRSAAAVARVPACTAVAPV